MFIDTHIHFDQFDEDGTLEEILERAQTAGVHKMVSIGGTSEANARSLKLAQAYSGRIFGCAGYDRDVVSEKYDLTELQNFLENPLMKAVGETGLDYHYTAENAAKQKKLFAENLMLAAEFKKPVVVHSRDADEDTLALLTDFSKAWKGDEARKGVLHCFTRGLPFARQVLELGLMISFSGIVTFANADTLRSVAQYVPIDRLLIETDAPYLAPAPVRGRRNEPAFVAHTAKILAQIKGCTLEWLANLTAQNACVLFGL